MKGTIQKYSATLFSCLFGEFVTWDSSSVVRANDFAAPELGLGICRFMNFVSRTFQDKYHLKREYI